MRNKDYVRENTTEWTLGTGCLAFTTRRSLGRDRERLCRMLDIDDSHLIIPHQTHGTTLRQIMPPMLTMPAEERQMILEGVDAVMTNITGVCIGVSTADCIPILLYDEQNHAVAAIHAGWRGTVQRIVQQCVCAMIQTYGSKARMLKAVIGPGISLRRFEVGDEVYDAFAQAGFDMGRIASKGPFGIGDDNKWHIDLKRCNRLQLLAAGLDSDNIEVSDICTYDDTGYFSARREQKGTVKCGRNFNAIMLC